VLIGRCSKEKKTKKRAESIESGIVNPRVVAEAQQILWSASSGN